MIAQTDFSKLGLAIVCTLYFCGRSYDYGNTQLALRVCRNGVVQVD